MKKTKKSGSAIFMYYVIAVCAVVCVISFALYYPGVVENGIVLWTGVTTFTIMYHLWLRLIMGCVTRRCGISYRHAWFRCYPFEPPLYKLLRVKKWKDKVLTYDPKAFAIHEIPLEQLADNMSKAETDHWINELISLSTLLFALIWGELWIFTITAVAAMLFDAQFIVIQRYNRPRVVKLLERKYAHT